MKAKILFGIFLFLLSINLASAAVDYYNMGDKYQLFRLNSTIASTYEQVGQVNKIFNSNPTWGASAWGTGFGNYATGTSDSTYLDTDHYTNGTDTFSVEFRLKATYPPGGQNHYIWSSGWSGAACDGTHTGIGSDIDSSGIISFSVCNGTDSVSNSTQLANNGLYHIVIVHNSTLTQIYIDGLLNNTLTKRSWVGNSSQDIRLFNRPVDTTISKGFLGAIDQFVVWKKELSAAEVLILNSSTSDSFQDVGVITSLLYPDNMATFNQANISFNASISPSSMNTTNATLFLWNSTDLVNTTTNIILGEVINITNWTLTNLALGDYIWNVYGCANNSASGTSECSFASSNRTFSIGTAIVSQTYNISALETSRQTFKIVVELFPGSTLYSAQFVYNGTNYTVSNISSSGGQTTLIRTIDLPANPSSQANTVRNFYWRFVYSGATTGTQELGLQTQTVLPINLQLCNATTTTGFINFTYYNQETGAVINAATNNTKFSGTFNYWLGSGSAYRNYSLLNLTSTSPSYGFCFTPSNQTIKVNLDMTYGATDYADRNYYLSNATLTNSTSNISLQLLTSDVAVKFFFKVVSGTELITNSLVTISQFFEGEGVYKTVAIGKTDSSGQFVQYLKLDTPHRFTVVKNGISLGTIEKTTSCQAAPCNIELNVETALASLWQGYYDVFAQNVEYSITFNQSSGIVRATFTDLTGLAQYFRFEVNRSTTNITGQGICNSFVYAASGAIDCNMTGYEGDFTARLYISRSPEKLVDFKNFVINALKGSLGIVVILISIFILVTITFAFAKDVAIGVFIVGAGILFLKVIGLLPISWGVVAVVSIASLWLAARLK